MDQIKIHPLILLALGISSLSIGVRAYNYFLEGNDGYGMMFGALAITFTILAVYGWMRNRKINRINRRIKKGQKLIR